MINDEKRREVVENLLKSLWYMQRDNNYKNDTNVVEYGNLAYRNIAAAVEPLGNLKKGNYAHIIKLLVDLIDRPTCEVTVHGKSIDKHNLCKSCSRCSYGWFEDIYDKPYSYCPNCGAKIIKGEVDRAGDLADRSRKLAEKEG